MTADEKSIYEWEEGLCAFLAEQRGLKNIEELRYYEWDLIGRDLSSSAKLEELGVYEMFSLDSIEKARWLAHARWEQLIMNEVIDSSAPDPYADPSRFMIR